MNDLIIKYELKAQTLIDIIQHPKSDRDEITRASVARRFVMEFIGDLKNKL